MKDTKKKQQKRDPGAEKRSNNWYRLQRFAQKYDAFILFLLIFFLYNTVTEISWSGDVIPASYLPLALIFHHTVFFDSMNIVNNINPNMAYAFPVVNGHYVSLFPIVTPVLATPIYLISCILMGMFSLPLNVLYMITIAKTAAAVIAALSCVFVYFTAKELFSRKTALITVLIYAFATSTWSVSSQALWQHGTVELLLIAMIWLVIRNERTHSKNANSRNTIIFLGLLSGLFVFNRPPDAVLLIPIIGYVVWYERKNLPVYAISAAVAGLPFLLYNLLIFGNVFGGYKENLDFFVFGIASIGNFAGLLIAPNVGLLIFSPVLILSVYGYLKLNSIPSEPIRRVLVIFGPAILLEILVYSFFGRWDSSVAYSFGQRFLTGFIPVLAIYVGIVVNESFGAGQEKTRAQAIQALIVLLVVASVIIQAIGVFLYPLYPDRSTSSEKTWDWNNSTIVASYGYGISHIGSVTTYSFPPLPALFHYQFSPGET